MATYVALVNVKDAKVQNAQEFASVWGDISRDIESLDGRLKDAYAILGEYDFLVLFEADEHQDALQIAIVIERYGLDTQTMEAMPVENIGHIVEEI